MKVISADFTAARDDFEPFRMFIRALATTVNQFG
jgi:hypothetical protein